jgi:porin
MASKTLRWPSACLIALASGTSSAADCGEDCGPYRLEGKYIHEVWRVPAGGIARQAGLANDYEHLGKVDLALSVDGARAFNLPGFTLFARAIYDNAGAVSGEYTGDAQGVSNIEATSAARLFELWTEWSSSSRRSLRVGLYDFNSEFDSNATGALFINPSHGIGKDISQSGRSGPSIFPVTSLGARVRWNLAHVWSMQMALLDGVPGDPERPKATTVRFGGDDGALLAAEIDRHGERLSKLAFGTWHYTGRFETFNASDAVENPGAQRGSTGAYTLAEVQLYRPGDDSPRGLAGFVRFGVADKDVNRFGSYAGTGLVYTGVVAADDQLGFAVARATNGGAYRRVEALAGIVTDAAETNLELTWRFAVREWLTLQPDVQYIFNPNTDPSLADALAIGLRFELSAAFP